MLYSIIRLAIISELIFIKSTMNFGNQQPHHTLRTTGVLLCIFAASVILVACNAAPKQIACSQEAKLCPDGSAVGRTGPSCEFAACPATAPFTGNWQTTTQGNVSFRYPQVTSVYMHPQDWPPTVTVTHVPYSCDTSSAVRTINGSRYCILAQAEGAAGSTYTTYTYSAPRADGAETVTLQFIIRATQCDNYDDPQKTACKEERAQFSTDLLADGILRSVQ